MTLFNAIAAAAVIGASYLGSTPAVEAQSVHQNAAHAKCRYSSSSAAYNNCVQGQMQAMRGLDAYMQRNGQPTMQQMWDNAVQEVGVPPELMQGLIVR